MNQSKSKFGWLVIKLDITKAFDTISWEFDYKFSMCILKCTKIHPLSLN